MLKSIKKYGILVLIAMVVLTSCMDKNARKNNYPKPDVDFTLPVGDVYTIDTLLYMWHAEGTHKFTKDASVYGIVTADETSGNLYKASFIQDGDYAIELYMKSTSGLRIGDSVRVYLKGATLSEYSGTPQIQDLDPSNVTILANGKFIEPTEISTQDLPNVTPNTISLLDGRVCKLVKFNHVEFAAADRDKTFAPENAYGQYNLNQYDEDCSLLDSRIVVRTSNYASFANKPLPQGNGSMVGIITCYMSNNEGVWQFTIRSLSEIDMNNDPCEESIILPTGSGSEGSPYNIAAGILNQGKEAKWLKGYIVGSANITTGTLSNDSQISWGPEFTYNENMTNVILADKPTERDINNCIIVVLPNSAPSGIREINLKDHPDNLGKVLKVKGNLKTYLGRNGMKDSNEYTLN